MSRVYKSAKALIAEHGLDPEKIKGTGKGGAVTKGDVERAVAGRSKPKGKGKPKKGRRTRSGAKKVPSQQDLIRDGLVRRLSRDEIVEAVLKVHPDSKITPGWVGWTIGNERRRETAWWKENRDRLA